jgi:hypothetical protein
MGLGTAALAAALVCVAPSLFVRSAAADDNSLSATQLATVKQQLTEALKNISPALKGQARVQAISQAITAITTDALAKSGASALVSVVAAADSLVPATIAVPAALSAAVSSGVAVPIAVAAVTTGAVVGGAPPTMAVQTVIAASAQQNLPTTEVGSGLGAAAASVAQSNPSAAVEISTTVANVAPSGMTQSYATSVISSGGSPQLADKSVQPPSAVVGGTVNDVSTVTLPASQPAGTQTGATSAGGQGSTQSITGNPSVGTSNAALPPCNNPSCS